MSCAIKISVYPPVFIGSILALWLCCSVGAAAQVSSSTGVDSTGHEALSAPKIDAARLQKAHQNFNSCTAKAAAAVKAGKSRLEELPTEIGRCKDLFPAAGLFQECKKNLFRTNKGEEINLEDVGRCKEILVAASFDPARPAPIYIDGENIVFAGVGLNRALRKEGMVVPNYNCTKLHLAFTDVAKNAQHLLFGNHPKVFLKGENHDKFLKNLTNLAVKPHADGKYLDVTGFGRLYGKPKDIESVVYFPAGSCEFEAKTGPIFAGVNLFYLTDDKNLSAVPYFGIIYYRPVQKVVNTTELVAEVTRILGPDFRPYSKDSHTIFIASTPFKDVDNERDPRNICELPRLHRLVAVVHTIKGSPNVPEYLLLANIRNLCEYGDLRAVNLVR